MRSTGLAVATVQRRICTWEFITEYVPPEHKDAFMDNWTVGMFSRGYRVAVKHSSNKHVGNYDYLPSGYDIEPADWLALSECVDEMPAIDRNHCARHEGRGTAGQQQERAIELGHLSDALHRNARDQRLPGG